MLRVDIPTEDRQQKKKTEVLVKSRVSQARDGEEQWIVDGREAQNQDGQDCRYRFAAGGFVERFGPRIGKSGSSDEAQEPYKVSVKKPCVESV